jgi:hypothetical protein
LRHLRFVRHQASKRNQSWPNSAATQFHRVGYYLPQRQALFAWDATAASKPNRFGIISLKSIALFLDQIAAGACFGISDDLFTLFFKSRFMRGDWIRVFAIYSQIESASLLGQYRAIAAVAWDEFCVQRQAARKTCFP